MIIKDGKVNDVTNVLFKYASTPQQMANMPIPQVQEMISSVGLAPKKAAYIVGLSKKILVDFNGIVPSSYKELESLPGVGHKTASVIMSQARAIDSRTILNACLLACLFNATSLCRHSENLQSLLTHMCIAWRCGGDCRKRRRT
jgi:hypothetical protein